MQALISYLPPNNTTNISESNKFHYSFECEGIIGVYKKERITPQKLLIEIELVLAHQSINLEQKELIELVKHVIVMDTPQLLEKMALEVKNSIINRLPHITHMNLIIKKPSALKHARCSYIQLIVDRGESIHEHHL